MKIYLVGGAIRDKLLNLSVKDRDWVVVGGTPKMLLELDFKQVGKDFPVFLHPNNKEEYSLARVDRKIGLGYTGFEFDYSLNITLKDDLMRRDLTINAIAQDDNGNYIDPFHGIQDIKNRILRHISPAFSEDPLRVLRIARFCSLFYHLGFKIAEETVIFISSMVKKKELLNLTRDRIWKETEKALNTNNPHIYFRVLYYFNVLSVLFPEINIIFNNSIYYRLSDQNSFFSYKKFDMFIELAKISKVSKNIDIRFSVLFFCIIRVLLFDINSYTSLIYKKELMQYLNMLCKRFCIPIHIKNLSIIFARFFKFLNVIHFQSSKKIVMFFYSIDAWRKPYIIKKLSILNNFYLKNFLDIENYKNYPKNFLLSSFDIVNKVSIKSILCKDLCGSDIKSEIINLRTNILEKWRYK
ncbi:MAG: tRNA CCA-pyrophosphorylase [Buchnera aphidicola (Chaetogeoica yunlongensis)]